MRAADAVVALHRSEAIMRTDLVALTIEQVLEDLILDVQLATSGRTALSPDTDEQATPHSTATSAPKERSLTSARIDSHRSTSTSVAAEPVQTLTALHSADSISPKDSNADLTPVHASSSVSATALQPWPSLHEPHVHEPASTAPRQADMHESRSSKLLVLKQKRLESLSSSLDLSRESSFDTSAISAQHATAKENFLYNSSMEFGDTGAHSSEPATSSQPAVQQRSIRQDSKALDSTSGEYCMFPAKQTCSHGLTLLTLPVHAAVSESYLGIAYSV